MPPVRERSRPVALYLCAVILSRSATLLAPKDSSDRLVSMLISFSVLQTPQHLYSQQLMVCATRFGSQSPRRTQVFIISSRLDIQVAADVYGNVHWATKVRGFFIVSGFTHRLIGRRTSMGMRSTIRRLGRSAPPRHSACYARCSDCRVGCLPRPRPLQRRHPAELPSLSRTPVLS